MPCIEKQDASIFISLDIRLGGPVQGWIGATPFGLQRTDCPRVIYMKWVDFKLKKDH